MPVTRSKAKKVEMNALRDRLRKRFCPTKASEVQSDASSIPPQPECPIKDSQQAGEFTTAFNDLSGGFNFLALPGELRNEFYRLVFTPVPNSMASSQPPSEHTQPIYILNDLVPPPLTCVSRQIRTECLPLFLEVSEIQVLIGKSVQDGKNEMNLSPTTRKWLKSNIGFDLPIMRAVHIHFAPTSGLGDLELHCRAMNKTLTVTHGPDCLGCAMTVQHNDQKSIPGLPAHFYKYHPEAAEICQKLRAAYHRSHERISDTTVNCLLGDVSKRRGQGLSVRDLMNVACALNYKHPFEGLGGDGREKMLSLAWFGLLSFQSLLELAMEHLENMVPIDEEQESLVDSGEDGSD